MSKIVFQDSYIVVIPSFQKTDTHKHPMLHLFLSEKDLKITANNKELFGKAILLDSNITHIAKEENGCEFFLLIDPASILAEQLQIKYLQGKPFTKFNDINLNIPKNLIDRRDEEIISVTEKLLSEFGVKSNENNNTDERVEQIRNNLISGKWLNMNVKEIADAVFLSESRLTHLFKEKTGTPLKSYILMRKMEHAYKFVNAGGKITQAAYESGFSSSAHLAYTCKTLTGISISEVLKESRFLKV